MDHAPYDFMLNHQETDLKKFLSFKHRTFNTTDTLYFIHFFHDYYTRQHSLENAFLCAGHPTTPTKRLSRPQNAIIPNKQP